MIDGSAADAGLLQDDVILNRAKLALVDPNRQLRSGELDVDRRHRRGLRHALSEDFAIIVEDDEVAVAPVSREQRHDGGRRETPGAIDRIAHDDRAAQLDVGETERRDCSSLPVVVLDVVATELNNNSGPNTCVLQADSSIFCWGLTDLPPPGSDHRLREF